MKKISLLMLGCLAVATSAMAVDWPENYTYTNNGSWFGNAPAFAGDVYERSVATAQNVVDFAVPADADEFDAIYTDLGVEYGIDKARSDNSAGPIATKAAYKVAYDLDAGAMYILMTYAAAKTSDLGCELMFCPFDKLEGANPPTTPDDKSGVPWMRYWELGGAKVDASVKEGAFVLGGYMACLNGAAGYSQSMPTLSERDGLTMKDCSSADAVKLVFIINFYVLDDKKNGVEFSYDLWKAACDEKGISFEAKFKKAANCEYMWNTTDNNVYFSNSFAGYLAPGTPIGVAEVAAAAANISIAGDLITLAEAGNIQIFSATGMLIASVSNVTEFSTAGLAAGVYIAVAGNESVSFVK